MSNNIVLAASLAALAGCSAFSQPQPQSAPAAVARPTPAQTEAQAATRDSSATRDDIKGVQGRLTRDGFYHGPIDGVWGPATSDALSNYQRAHNLAVTGKLNSETLDSFTP
jgi:peptidoglycan hydrolase-like protein with peptidoglycan-binding domain